MSVLFIAVIFATALAHGWGLSNSKLSIHTSMGSHSWEIINQGKPRVVKLLDNFSDAKKIKQTLGPSSVIVGRIYHPNQPQNGDPKVAAQNWFNNNIKTIEQYPAVDYWEGYNEPNAAANHMGWLGEFEAARVHLLAEKGKKASIGNFGTGSPDVTNPPAVKAFYPAITAAQKAGGILGLHEYSAPNMSSLYSGTYPCGGTGWLTGRYRKLLNEFLIPDNKTLPIVISENGIDTGTCGTTKSCPQGTKDGGYKTLCNYWSSIGLKNCSNEYMKQLEWYDQLMQCDKYIIGSTIFCLEIGANWDSFDITPLTTEFVKYLQGAGL